MVEAGWHFAPTLESDDMVMCAYCDLALDGWEAGDNPKYAHFSPFISPSHWKAF